MKAYEARLILYGTRRIEDPHCPSEWRGSGCYDIDVPFKQRADALVFAESEEQARQKIYEYDYADQPDYAVETCEEPTILSIEESEESHGSAWGDVHFLI